MGCSRSTAVAVSEPFGQRRFQDLYTLGRKLGEGAFGQVRAAKPRRGGGEVAVKVVDVRGFNVDGQPTRQADRDRVEAARAEIRVWEAVGANAHCVHLQGTFFDRTLFFMVMEKCDCSLMDKLATLSIMTELDLARILREMLLGIEHVHSVGIAHRDVKPDNFLLGGVGGKIVKLCDFGLATKMPTTDLLKGVCGTAPYMSPEMLLGGGYDQLTDVWSFGTTAYLMIHGDFPYSPVEVTAAAMKQTIKRGKPEIRFVRPQDEEGFFRRAFVDGATPFLRAVLQRAPAMRRSAGDALRLPFLNLDWQSSEKVTTSPTQVPLAPAIRKARQATEEVKRPANPIVQRQLDELLQRLQGRLGASGASSAMCFSESAGEDAEGSASPRSQPRDERIRRRRKTRHSTHSGVVFAVALADLGGLRALGREDSHCAASTATPGSGGESGRSAGSSPSFGGGRTGRTPLGQA